MVFWNIGILLAVALGVWWLTGMDKTTSGESKCGHYFSRTLRCVAVAFLTAVFLWLAKGGGGPGGAALLLILPISIALVLRSSVAELFSQVFLRLADPTLHDNRPLDPGKSRRYMDTIAHLIKTGRRDEAIKLCEELKLSGDLDALTLENTLEFLEVKQERTQALKPLSQAAQLRAERKFAGAEELLKQLLAKQPADTGAAMMLMRLYAQNLAQPGKAHEVLRELEKQPDISASHIEFARRSIDEWSRTEPGKVETVPRPKVESADELLTQGFVGSAIERLEEQIKQRPQDLVLQMKLAEVHAVNCRNLQRAEKIIRQMELNFSPQQIETARAQLAKWRKKADQPHSAA